MQSDARIEPLTVSPHWVLSSRRCVILAQVSEDSSMACMAFHMPRQLSLRSTATHAPFWRVEGSRRALCRAKDFENRGTNLGDFCSIDAAGKMSQEKSLAEREAEFIEVLL
jgi:hypothetical protein